MTPAGVVTTLAGAAGSGTRDGVGTAARFNLLSGIAVDAAGVVYVGDFLNNAVRKITPDGTVTTLAGLSGTRNFGFVDGVGSAARFDGPTGLCVDANGTVYVADSYNNAIRRITADGTVTTVAGSPSFPENIDGPLPSARFYGPADVALAPDGSLIVADAYNSTVRRMVLAAPTPPVLRTAPRPLNLASGATVALNATAEGPGPLTYQWSKDGVEIAGATSSTYVVSSDTAATAGSYSVAVTGAGGTVVSNPARLSVVNVVPGAIVNLSARTTAGSGARTLTLGFVVAGSVNKPVLIRGVGPSLAQYGVTGALANPSLTVIGPGASGLTAASNDDWLAADAPAMAATGAFPLVAGGRDAALVASLAPGSYTAQITDVSGGSGIALAEVYDTAPGVAARLVNLSARAQVERNEGILIAGFTISGAVAKTVLIRGVGPGLVPYGVAGVLNDPRLELYDGGNSFVLGNDDWAGTAALSAVFAQTGAFALTSVTSKDSALLVTLAPGSDTAKISGVSGATGVALVELYEVGN